MRNRQGGQRLHPIGMVRGDRPPDECAPVVADDVGSFESDGVEQGEHIGGQFALRVVPSACGASTWRVATLVRREGPEPVVVQDFRDQFPARGPLGEPVQQHDRFTVDRTFVGDVEGVGSAFEPGDARRHR